MMRLLAVLFAAGMVGGVYWLGAHNGYGQAQSECQAASLQGELDAKAKELAYLQGQFKAQGEALASVDAERGMLARDVALARAEASRAPVAKDCTLGPDAVQALNLARTGRGR